MVNVTLKKESQKTILKTISNFFHTNSTEYFFFFIYIYDKNSNLNSHTRICVYFGNLDENYEIKF